MLKIVYNGKDIEIPLDTKISNVSDIIAKQAGTKNIHHKIYLCNSVVHNQHTPHNVFVDDSNKDMELYKIYAKIKSTLRVSKPYAKNNTLRFPNTNASISFERTLRVPINNNTYPLPQTLGSYELINVNDEYILPMYQCEAMWMKFNIYPKHRNVAIKIGCGDINIISGKKWQDGVLASDHQNYVVLPYQSWLDGVKVNTDLVGHNVGHYVRQFVAMPLTDESLIEKQMKETNIISDVDNDVSAIGGIKFEVFGLYDKLIYNKFYIPSKKTRLVIPN